MQEGKRRGEREKKGGLKKKKKKKSVKKIATRYVRYTIVQISVYWQAAVNYAATWITIWTLSSVRRRVLLYKSGTMHIENWLILCWIIVQSKGGMFSWW